MTNIRFIRKHFKPTQPGVGVKDEHVIYREFEPASPLQNYIHCYWELKSKQRLAAPFSYRVVSDGCIDLFFNLNDTTESFIMGFCDKYTAFSIGTEFAYGGIRFYPSIFPALFGTTAKTFVNGEQWLKDHFPFLAEFIRTTFTTDFLAAIPKIDQFFSVQIQDHKPQMDDRFFSAFLEILRRKGHLEIEKELNTGVSPRQLRRLFAHYIGTSPKSFCQVVRFQYILNTLLFPAGQPDDKAFYDVGFFDQAHFIKNFTRFYGVTPSKVFALR
ncbi:MAG: helix-turn-helix domain-containing protein [Bacteroidota bacterium]